MKILLPMLVIPFFCFSQTDAERQKIVATYDQELIRKVKDEAKTYMEEQQRLIAEYKRTHYVEESEYHSLQRMHNGMPIFFSISNDGSSKSIRTNSMYPGGALGLSVTGQDMTVGVWDGGKVRDTHVELANRAFPSDDADALSAHATHVTGTIIAGGVSASRRGIAYQATAYTHDWNSDYNEMLDFGANGYVVSNHSYGYSTDDLPIWKFGSYDASAIEIDQVSNTYPYYQVVIAAGNDRNNTDLEQSSAEGGFDLLSGTAVSKNGITVAAVNQLLNYNDPSNVVMSDFSNFGPPDDGRVKPDIAAKGVNTDSCISTGNALYAQFSGTSMAAPAVAGMIVLLQKHYDNLNSNFMRASTVRGLICHTAREAGVDLGPDYEYGWGMADARSAADVISKNGLSTIIEENTLMQNQTFTKQISITQGQMLTATICWTDPVGSGNVSGAEDNRTGRIKNNLDLKILKDGETYYPWKLNPDDPAGTATRDADNDVDNVEKVQIDFADPGVYTIQVKHKGNLTGGSQAFSLIANGSGPGLGLNNNDFSDNIVVYPNPVKSTLNFALPENAALSSLVILDVLGKQVNMTAQVINNSVDISNLSSGVYFAKFMSNGKYAVKKFIKE